jgi:hypothetical protein
MLLERRPWLRRLAFYSIGLVCLCVMMYMLGSAMTLWTLQFALDKTDNPVLEGFSLPTSLPDATPAMPVTPSRDTRPGLKKEINEHNLLRPPNAPA